MKSSPSQRVLPRRALAAGFTAVAGLLVFASVAWACTAVSGSTFYSDGTQSKTLARGAAIGAYAVQAPAKTDGYILVIGHTTDNPTHGCMSIDYTINNTVRYPNSSGFISTTVGTAGTASPASPAAGTYEVCFRDPTANNAYATSAATLALT